MDQQAAAPAQVTLSTAVKLAQANEPTFRAALAAQRSAQANSYLAKAALLPSVVYHNQVLYTQPNGQTNQGGQIGSQASPVFIANNAVREYASQAVVNETVSLKGLADAQSASARAARSTAELEISRRGLVSAVVSLYYQVGVAASKREIANRALEEAQAFAALTRQREAARETAHADVVKADLEVQGRQRELADSQLLADKARLDMAVLLFADPRTSFTTEALVAPAPLPTREEVARIAGGKSPELRSALAELAAANADVKAARAAYLPDLGLNFTYGIDAPQFATRGPDSVRNLGYSMSATVDIPVWDWFSTQKRVQQSETQRSVARTNLSAAQRRLLADIDESYDEAATARQQLQLLDESVHTAEESLRLTKLRYGAGESTALEVVDAQNLFFAAEQAQSDGLLREATSLAALQLLIGSL